MSMKSKIGSVSLVLAIISAISLILFFLLPGKLAGSQLTVNQVKAAFKTDAEKKDRGKVPTDVLAIVDLPRDQRSADQTAKLAKHFRSPLHNFKVTFAAHYDSDEWIHRF